MKVTVTIPDREWARLLGTAEAHGLKVPDLLRMGIESVFPKRLPLGEDVMRHLRMGLPDAVVAERLGIAKATVSRMRRSAGLPNTRFKRADWPREFQRKAS